MRSTHRCPKCGGGKIIRVEGRTGAYGAGNNIPLGMTVFSSVKVPRYVCCTCGYAEEWVDKEDLDRLWEKLS